MQIFFFFKKKGINTVISEIFEKCDFCGRNHFFILDIFVFLKCSQPYPILFLYSKPIFLMYFYHLEIFKSTFRYN